MRAVVVLLAVSLLACSGSTPLAHFVVVKEAADESCTKLTDFCVRGRCTVHNDSQLPGQVVVDRQLVKPDGTVLYTESERTELGGGDTTTLTHDFKQAKVFEKNRTARFVLRCAGDKRG